jgi:hypothetical protein
LAPVRKLLLLKGLLLGLVLLLYMDPKPGLPATAVVRVKGGVMLFAAANRFCAGVAGDEAALRRLDLLKASRGAEEGRARFAASFRVRATSCALSHASMLDSWYQRTSCSSSLRSSGVLGRLHQPSRR